MNEIQSLLESANPWTSLQGSAAKIAKKWEKVGLLEGIDNTIEKNNMALILENQAKQLLVEQSQTGTGASFTTGTGEQWAGIALPLVRKVFGQIAAKEFVSVQPMNLPSGLVFFLDFQYGTSVKPFSSGDSLYGASSANFGNTNTGGLYGEGRFGYSINQFSSSVTATVTSASYSDVQFNAELSASIVAGTIKKMVVATSSISADMDTLGYRAFLINSGSISDSRVLQAYTSYAGGANLTFFVTASTAEIDAVNAFKVYYNKATKDNARGDFESGASYSAPNNQSSTDIVIPQINVSMRSEGIIAKTRKLKAQWTPEFAQDLNAYQSLDAEAELTSIMSEYISLEIDLEIMEMLIDAAAAGTEYWTAENNKQINTAGSDFTAMSSGYYNSQGQWFQTLGTKIQKLSNIIHQRTMRGGANFMVISPTVSTIIESIPGFASNHNGEAEQMKYAFGVQKMGQAQGKYTVYKNPYMKENIILLGYKGSQFLETGAVFAPYIPLIMTPLVYDPDTFVPRKGLLTRYAKKMVRPEYFGKIVVAGLNTL